MAGRQSGRFSINGAAQESNLPSVGLRRRTGFEDQLGHRPQPLHSGAYRPLREPDPVYTCAFAAHSTVGHEDELRPPGTARNRSRAIVTFAHLSRT
jgi:hypothetical protein